MFISEESIFMKTGLAPHLRIDVADDGKLNDGIKISSPALKSASKHAISIASVPEAVKRAFLHESCFSNNFSHLSIKLPGKKNTLIKKIKIPLLGIHNIRNSTAAAAVASTIGIPKEIIKQGLKEFKGVQRRFNKIFTYRETNFYDDYAHHPTEIKEVLNGVRAVYKKEEIICVFQPHRISRLKDLKKEFSLSFKKADSVILCPIYAAGEKLKLGFNYNDFAKDIIKNSKVKLFLVKDQYQLAKFVKNNIYGKKIVIGMGAGSISNWMKELPKLI